MFILLLACRPDPGNPSYPDYEALQQDTAVGDEYAGPDPFVAGEKRLSLGIFYEGGYSDIVEIDAGIASYYIWENTYDVIPSSDRIEGALSDSLVKRDSSLWMGGGILWEPGGDLSEWTHLNVSLKSSQSEFLALTIGMEDVSGVAANLNAIDYGFNTDDAWHHISIPLSDLVDTSPGFSLGNVSYVLTHICENLAEGPGELKIDNLYLSIEEDSEVEE